MSIVRCKVHPQAEGFFAALLERTEFRTVSRGGTRNVGSGALLLTAYQPAACEQKLNAGIQQLVQWRRERERAPALILSFRSKQRLLRLPANGILREPGSTFLRLPCRREALLTALQVARPLSPLELEKIVHRACTSWGQLANYIDRLIETVGEGESVPDLGLLDNFARRHFGNWFSEALARAATYGEQNKVNEMTRVLRDVQARAPEVAVYHTFERLAHGRKEDLSNRGLGPLRTMLLSIQQGVVEDEHLERLLAFDSWASFKVTLQNTASTLTLLESGHATLPGALATSVNVFLTQLRCLLRMTETGAIQEQPATTIKIIDSLQEATLDILRRRAEAQKRQAFE